MRRAHFTTFLALLLAVAPLAVGARQGTVAPEKLQTIEKTVDAKRLDLHIPGVALGIVKDGKVVYLGGLGYRDLEQKLPATPDTLFAIGSCTKAFTAMTALMAVDDGKLALTNSPHRYLPYFRLRDPEADSKITISDLLCHRSGLGRTDLAWYTGKLKSEDVIRVASLAKPTAKLGEKFQYQNVMFLAAGMCVAKAEHTPWESFLRRRIFDQLTMKDTNTSVPRTLRDPNHALGYTWDESEKKSINLPMRSLPCVAPAGAINSNARDMVKWVSFMLDGGVVGSKRLVSRKLFPELFVKRISMGPTVGYGYGWMLRNWNGHAVMEHGGNIDGFNADVALMPDQHLGLVMLTNVSVSPLASTVMESVWSNLVGAPKASSPVVASGSALDPQKEAGVYPLPGNNTIEVIFREGKLSLRAPSQPEYPLESLGGRKYKLGAPAPDGFYATFRPDPADSARTELFLEQPQGNITLKREAVTEYKSPISVDDLMSKVVDAIGGASNLRKHHSLVLKQHVEQEEQGVSGEMTTYREAPSRFAEVATVMALGKRIATSRDYYSGSAGGQDVSFLRPHVDRGDELANAATVNDFYGPLDWRKLYKKVAITGVSKVGSEDCYVVEKTPEKGAVLRDYVSTGTFLVMKRQLPDNVVETYSEYRPVDGVLIPFKRVVNPGGDGAEASVIVVKSAHWDAPISLALFRPRETQTASATEGDQNTSN